MSARTVPEVRLTLEGSTWPPARDGLPAGQSWVGDWSVTRELVSSSFGVSRVRSGLSVGTASATIRQQAKQLAPWAVSSSLRVTAGTPAMLSVDTLPTINLGAWQTSPVQGSLSSASVDVSLIERQYAARSQEQSLLQPNLPPEALTPMGVMLQLAESAGYRSYQKPFSNTTLSVPLQGSATGYLGSTPADIEYQSGSYPSFSPSSYVEEGTKVSVMTGSNFALLYKVPSTSSALSTLTASRTVVAEVLPNERGEFDLGFTLGESWAFSPMMRIYRPTTTSGGGGSHVGYVNIGLSVNPQDSSGVIVPSLVPITTYDGVPLSIRVTYTVGGTKPSPSNDGYICTSLAASVYVDGSLIGSASTSYFHSMVNANYRMASVFNFSGIGGVAGVQFRTAHNSEVVPTVTPVGVTPINGSIYPFFEHNDEGGVDVWTALQQMADSYMAAVFVDLNGVLQIRDREWLRGSNRPAETIDVDTLVDDIQWAISREETYAGLEVTYYPGTMQSLRIRTSGVGETYSGNSTVLWESPEVISLAPRETRTMTVPVDVYGERAHRIVYAPTATDNELQYMSVFSVHDNAEGEGDPLPASSASISFSGLFVGRMTITVKNNSASRIYLVDANGSPCLIIRSSWYLDQGSPATVTFGDLSNTDHVLRVDLGRNVQTETEARLIASYLWSQISTPSWTAESIRMPVKWDRDLGDVLELYYPQQGLQVRAVVTKVSIEGGPGRASQTVDLIIYGPQWGDFDKDWLGKTWAQFDSGWSGYTWADFDANPLRR